MGPIYLHAVVALILVAISVFTSDIKAGSETTNDPHAKVAGRDVAHVGELVSLIHRHVELVVVLIRVSRHFD